MNLNFLYYSIALTTKLMMMGKEELLEKNRDFISGSEMCNALIYRLLKLSSS